MLLCRLPGPVDQICHHDPHHDHHDHHQGVGHLSVVCRSKERTQWLQKMMPQMEEEEKEEVILTTKSRWWHWVYYLVPSHRSCNSILIS